MSPDDPGNPFALGSGSRTAVLGRLEWGGTEGYAECWIRTILMNLLSASILRKTQALLEPRYLFTFGRNPGRAVFTG